MTTAPAEKPFQFTLQQMLWLVSMACAAAAAWYWMGIYSLVFIAPLAGAAFCFSVSRRWVETCVVAIALFLVAAILLPGPTGHRHASRRMQCGNHLKQIALGLQNYHDVYGSFPPAFVADASGKPLHSWRVLILPFVEGKTVYDAYDFNEPWNGPNNSKLHARMPHCYSCPACADNQPPGETNYLAVVGPGTIWSGATATTMDSVTDGVSTTLLVVEAHSTGIHWMEPRDLHLGQMPMAINAPRGTGISSPHPTEGAVAVFADGHTEFLRNDLPSQTLRALLTIAGGEKVQADDY